MCSSDPGKLVAAGVAVAAAVCALAVFAAVAFALDKDDLRQIARRARPLVARLRGARP